MQTGLFGSTQMRILTALTLLMVIIALGSYASVNFQKLDFLNPMPATISVTGEGEVVSVPDVGQFSFSVNAEGETAAEAQDQAQVRMDSILGFLAEQGVAETDIKTENYNLYPRYRYEERVCIGNSFCPPGEQIPDGFEVSQTVSVKVRDTAMAGAVIAGVGAREATNISNLNFTIDDIEVLEAEAKAAAIKDAQEKAAVLADQLGVRIVRLSYYSEDSGKGYVPYYMEDRMMSVGMGGVPVPDAASLPVGENTTTARVTITYQVQ